MLIVTGPLGGKVRVGTTTPCVPGGGRQSQPSPVLPRWARSVEQQSPKQVPQAGSITTELIRNADSQAHPTPTEPETLRLGKQSSLCVLTHPPWDSEASFSSRTSALEKDGQPMEVIAYLHFVGLLFIQV